MAVTIHRHFIDRLALLNGLISGIALYPQVWEVLQNHSAGGISLPTFSVILINSVVWLLYAAHRGLVSLAVASVFNIVASAMLIFAIATFN
jgi:uncharacterized protein with PQ loop repeat